MNEKEEDRSLMARLDELANIEEEKEMGTANPERVAHPIGAMESIKNKVIELHERISDLESRLGPLLLADSPVPKEPNDPSHTDPPARSDLMESIEDADERISRCIGYVNGIIDRLDL